MAQNIASVIRAATTATKIIHHSTRLFFSGCNFAPNGCWSWWNEQQNSVINKQIRTMFILIETLLNISFIITRKKLEQLIITTESYVQKRE